MPRSTKHYLFFGDCTDISKIPNLPSIDLIITSPPYFNAPFDYSELYDTYENYLELIFQFGSSYYKKMSTNGIIAINIDNMLVKGFKYPIISDTIKIFTSLGFKLNGRIIWKKPDGYVRISQRSGVLLQNPYPMYYYPDNLVENIILFQKKRNEKGMEEEGEMVEIDDVWEMTNVLPIKGRLETNIAAFPETLPERLIELFSRQDSYICDPFLGSGTTMKVARQLKRNSIGFEILRELEPIIIQKTGFQKNLESYLSIKNDNLKIKYIEKSEEKTFTNSRSLISLTLKDQDNDETHHKYHLLILDLKNSNINVLGEEISETLNNLLPGRIALIFFDSIPSKNSISLNEITDCMFEHGLKLRDKITVRHKTKKQWEVVSRYNKIVRFNHRYYEVLIFQKGNFNYKSKTPEEKKECTIDKQRFQDEKWFLSFWDMKNQGRRKSYRTAISRLIELFLYNNEKIGTNISRISCRERDYEIDLINI